MHILELPSRPRAILHLGLLVTIGLFLPRLLDAADVAKDIVQTKDSLTINKGIYLCTDDSLKTVPQYVIAGTFFSNLFVSPKFPCGGTMQVGPSAAARLNADATMIFKGGYVHLNGETSAAVEQVKQIQFLSGMSEIRLECGNDGNACTTLRANDVVRNQGATVMVGGDEKRSQTGFHTAMGVAEKLSFAGGMAKHLKGAGGPAGATNRSIIPWMTVGTYLQPGVGGMATYDPEKGVQCLAPAEYDKKLQGTPDRNVWIDNATLGENKTQTVNACVFKPYYGMEIGAGSTLTITSGFLQFGGSTLSGPPGPSAIGFHPHKRNWAAVAGTIDFGPAEGIIWSNFDGKYGPNIVGAVIAGSGGLTIAGSNTLILLNANTYTGKTCVGSGILQLGDVIPNQAKLGNGDVEVAAGATLRIMPNVANAIADAATISLLSAGVSFYGVMDLGKDVNETVASLRLDGKAQPAGTYGSSASAAAHKLDQYFAGPGILTVTSDGAAERR